MVKDGERWRKMAKDGERWPSEKTIQYGSGEKEKRMGKRMNKLISEDTIPPNLQEQKTELELHLRKYPDEYPTDLHSKSL
jgi:hypothetical protein